MKVRVGIRVKTRITVRIVNLSYLECPFLALLWGRVRIVNRTLEITVRTKLHHLYMVFVS